MIKQTVTISNKLGLHARPSAQITQAASRFAAEVWLSKSGRRVNAKSIMGVITLGATFNTELKIIANGPDEAKAVDAIEKLFNNRFEEE